MISPQVLSTKYAFASMIRDCVQCHCQCGRNPQISKQAKGNTLFRFSLAIGAANARPIMMFIKGEPNTQSVLYPATAAIAQHCSAKA